LTTIKDIALEAKVSPGTVDRVLHKRGGVSPKTEEKIKKILKQKNFKINLIASSLAMKKHYNLGMLIPSFDDENLFWKSPYSGIRKAKQEVNAYGIETNIFIFNQFDPKSYKKTFNKLIKTNPDAIVLVPMFNKETQEFCTELDVRRIPFLFFNINLEGFNNITYVGQKSFDAGSLSAQLLELCTNPNDEILVVKTRRTAENYRAISQRVVGFKHYFEKKKSKQNIHQLDFDNLNDLVKTKSKINSYLKENKGIKGLLVPSSRVSNIIALIENNYLNKLRIVGFDTTPKNVESIKNGRITFLISQKSFNQGYNSVITMSNFLIHKEKPNKELSTPLEIITKENIAFSQFNRRTYFNEN
jgi:LacI family transcriptional regulator